MQGITKHPHHVYYWNDLIAKMSYNQLYAREDTMLAKYKQTEK